MRLRELELRDFRNYRQQLIPFEADINVIHGANGHGKTSLLEAIHFAVFTRSFKASRDRDCIHFGAESDQFQIRAVFDADSGLSHDVGLRVHKREGKTLTVDQTDVRPYRDHIGFIPTVLLKPDDIGITTGSPAERRRFLDVLISQYSAVYLDDLTRYRRVLKQKNALLSRSGEINPALMESYNESLAKAAATIYQKRIDVLPALTVEVERCYQMISGSDARIQVDYVTQIGSETNTDAVRELFRKAMGREIQQRKSLVGPQRDDLTLKLNGTEVGAYGSQGENKTYLIALKMAELNVLRMYNEHRPILLFDDIFSELDDDRTHRLIDEISDVGQTFITTTDKRKFDRDAVAYFHVHNGSVSA